MVPLHEALLDDEALAQLIGDVTSGATLLGVTTKGGARVMAVDAAGDPRAQLRAAHAALRAGAIAGVQLRYRHDGREWWDTLMLVVGGVRLIRICHDDALRSSP
jgi:hypothetical protein